MLYTSAGFGDTIVGDTDIYPNHLQHAALKYVTETKCKETFSFITPAMMCAIDTSGNTCRGDSGGPLYDEANNVLVGVSSFVANVPGQLCRPDVEPAGFARIADQVRQASNCLFSDLS